ncbi:MAG: hypothetical protein WAU01_06985, partial [Saprospiraceae bacterium]
MKHFILISIFLLLLIIPGFGSNTPLVDGDITAVITNACATDLKNGKIDLSISGGLAPYEVVYSKVGGQTIKSITTSNNNGTEDIDSLSVGKYKIVVIDHLCGKATLNIIIGASIHIIGTTTPTCNNNTGKVMIQNNGLNGPYQYIWSTGLSTKDLTGVGVGVYTVTVTSSNNCSSTSEFIIDKAPDMIIEDYVNLGCTPTQSYIVIYTEESTEPITYIWNNGATSDYINNLAHGIYQVTATDSHGCTASKTFEISSPTTITLASQAICTTGTGMITSSITSGHAPYTYLWSTGATTKDISGLDAGTYTVTVTDRDGCGSTASTTIESKEQSFDIFSLASVQECNKGTHVIWDINGAGENVLSNYDILWSDGSKHTIFSIA